MSDDVKVKFGGDFSDLAKGAEDAAKKAGTAMQGWVSDFRKSLASSLANAFSLQNIVGTLYSKGMDTLTRQQELSVLSKSLGISSTELQQFSEMGKLAGLSQDQMGKAVQNANRLIAQAAVGNKGSQEALRQMGFTTKEVTSGQIKALDIVYKLGDQFKKTGNEVVTAARAQAAFGESGNQMIDILRQGNEAIRERIKLMQIYSEEEVRRGRRTKDAYDRGKAVVDKVVGGATTEVIGSAVEASDMGEIYNQALKNVGRDFFGKNRLKPMGQKEMTELVDEMIKIGASKGVSAQTIADFHKELATGTGGKGFQSNQLTNQGREFFMRLSSYAELAATQEENLKKKQLGESRYLSSAIPVLAASSLQQIGGGDVASVMSGLMTNSIEENTKRTAEATEKIANKDATATPSRAAIINKAK
jgi:hypothetical protein